MGVVVTFHLHSMPPTKQQQTDIAAQVVKAVNTLCEAAYTFNMVRRAHSELGMASGIIRDFEFENWKYDGIEK